jgi:NIMA (never in mitosis gene a)-related kinase
MGEKERQMIVSEVNILRELRHPNIVRYYDRIIDREQAKIYIIMEYCDGGDMATLIKRCKKDRTFLPEDMIWSVLS